MKVYKTKKLPYPIVSGDDEGIREWAISVLGHHISQNDAHKSPEAFLVFERLVNSKFTQSPVEGIHEDLKRLDSRIRHIETNQNAQGLRNGQKANSRGR